MSTTQHTPAGPATTAQASRPPRADDTFPFPSKSRSRTTTQHWVRKCGRSITNSETPQGANVRTSRSGRRGSNPRPSAWEADALPTELHPQSGRTFYGQRTAVAVGVP
jgi:hypothetical protein